MQELRQSTEIKVRIGSAVDATDGVTPETGLTLGAADQAELLKHNGAATADISASTFAAITAVDGWYDLTLTAGNTDTLGQITVVIQDSSLMAPIFRDFMVVTANYWDSKYSTDTRQVDVTQIGGVAQSATDLKDFADTGYDPATHYTFGVTTCTTTTTNTDMVGTDNAALAATALSDAVWTNAKAAFVDASIAAIPTTAMRGTDSAALAATALSNVTWTDAKAGALADWINGGRLDAILDLCAVEANIEGHVNTSLSAYDGPTDAEMITAFTEIKGATWAAGTDTLEHIRNKQTDIETDTAEIGTAGAGLTALGDTRIGNLDATVSSRLAPAGTLATVTDLTNAPTAGDLTATMKTSVNDQVADVMKTDTVSEMSQAAPPATPTFEEMFAYIYFMFRNKNVETSSEHSVYDNAGTTKLFKSAISDSAGVLTKSEYVSGV